MASVRSRNGMLFVDFRYCGVRCREQTLLPDTPANRRKVQPLLERIDTCIKHGIFVYEDFFPGSPRAKQFVDDQHAIARRNITVAASSTTLPLLSQFAAEWWVENEIRWKQSYQESTKQTLDKRILPVLGHYRVDEISRAELLKFRAGLVTSGPAGRTITNDRVNHIMTPLRLMLADAAERFNFVNPCLGLKPLRVKSTDVDPFSLPEVKAIIEKVRSDFRNYYTVRFFTGLRTAEIDGLQWKYVDFSRRLILVRETVVNRRIESTKTPESVRDVWMSKQVLNAMKSQYESTGKLSDFVFCNRLGKPLMYRDVSRRIWYPLLRYLNLKRRRPYQTRHTAATLWLAAGENPEWIARQMGHTTTRMLFTVYSRFVPNLTRKDGSAFESLLESRLEGNQEDEGDCEHEE